MNFSEYFNGDLTTIITPINVKVYEKLLKESNFDPEESKFLVNGFTYGFNLGYRGPWKRKDTSRNIPFQVGGVRSKEDMWEKIMTEIKLGRYAGLFEEIPYKYYVQSPIGLVPKSNNKTRLIFHLSYNFKEYGSINSYIPPELCSVKYNDIEHAVLASLKLLRDLEESGRTTESIFYSKTDLVSTFRILPLKLKFYKLLILKANHPISGKTYFFVEKNLVFGISISCSHFHRFSESLRHMFEHLVGATMICTAYLDDYLFYTPSEVTCNNRLREFLSLCQRIGVPTSLEKTEWALEIITSLGVNFNGRLKVLMIPEEKRNKALNWLKYSLNKKKATVKELEQLTGLLNFLGRAIIPGRAFT